MNKPVALLSVADKTGLAQLGQSLSNLGWDLLASGGTARSLVGAGLVAHRVSDWTGFPEVLGGRVKTLHPVIHAALLARPTEEHMAELQGLDIRPIDMVVCNLYPFARTIAGEGVTVEEAVEQIDIGGVTLLRAAAKNYARVTVVVDAGDYPRVLNELAQGTVSLATRQRLAYKAFAHTATYDETIRDYLRGEFGL